MKDLLTIFGLHRTTMLLNIASNVVKAFDQEFGQDVETKLAAAESFIELMKSYKNETKSQLPTGVVAENTASPPAV